MLKWIHTRSRSRDPQTPKRGLCIQTALSPNLIQFVDSFLLSNVKQYLILFRGKDTKVNNEDIVS